MVPGNEGAGGPAAGAAAGSGAAGAGTGAGAAGTTNGGNADAGASGAGAAEVKYDLKLPPNSKVDASLIERTTAYARTSGLSPEAAQTLLEERAQEITTETEKSRTAAVDEYAKSYAPGGKAWTAQQEEYKAQALADKELGGGKPETLAANVESAKQALAKIAGADAPVVEKFLTDSGLGSSPVVLKLFLRIANAMKEDSSIFGEPRKPGEAASTAEKWYGGESK